MSGIPEVSFCLPTFNSAARIERCLRAVLAQKVSSREILLVDNASTDDTVAKARALLANIPEARIVVNERNIGRIENWNRCLELATGNYLKFALANDISLPGSAEMLLQAARKHPGTVMVCSQQINVDEVPQTPQPVPANPATQTLPAGKTLQRFSKDGNDTGGLGGMLITGDWVRKHSLRFHPNIPYWADFYFAIELAALGHTAYVDAPSYLFDKSIKSRFAVSGTATNTYTLCFEARECSLLLAKLLPAHGIESWHGFEYLYAIYTGGSWFGPLISLSTEKTRELFEGAGPFQTRVMNTRWWTNFGRFEHPIKRLFSKIGLYHYPGENKGS